MTRIISTIFLFLLSLTVTFAQTTVTSITDGNPDDDMAVDSNGNIFASNFPAGRIYKITPEGVVTEFVNAPGSNPNGLAVDSNDHLWVCNFSGNNISHLDTNGDVVDSFFISGNPSGMIKAIDNDDMIYTRFGGNTINRITPTGDITEVSNGDNKLDGPVGLAYDEFGALFVGNYNNRKIFRVLGNGELAEVATVGSAGNLGFIAFGQGMLWGTVLQENKIYLINPEQTNDVTLYAGSTAGNMDGPLAEATFNQPNGILFDPADETTLYITDFGSKNLRIISGVDVDIIGINDFDKNKTGLQISPNPSQDYVNVRALLPEIGTYNIAVYDVLGKLVFSSEGYSDVPKILQNINIRSWNKGIYFLRFTVGDYSETKKFVK